jgi:hypothetical protein
MRRLIQILWLMVLILIINGCALFGGAAVFKASSEINKSTLSNENKDFENKVGVNLTYVKRGLWSTQDYYKNDAIQLYYKSLLNNMLVYSVDENKKEFAQQKTNDNTISIVVNKQYQNYTEFEKAVLLIASTSTLALLTDSNFNKNDVPNMFFKIIENYNANQISNIINAQWFKDRKIAVTSDSILIE